MADFEKALLIGLILFFGLILLFLLYATSGGLVENVKYLDEVVKPTNVLVSTTTQPARSPSEASNARVASTTLVLPKTTVSIPKTVYQTTMSSPATSSSMQSTSTTTTPPRCRTAEDCGGGSELKCKGNYVYNYTTTYRCSNPGTEYATCVGKTKSEVVYGCEEYEDCFQGDCVPIYSSECEYRCYLKNMEGHYCSSECIIGDAEADVEGDCSVSGKLCCCTKD